jgi:hypothetical protein
VAFAGCWQRFSLTNACEAWAGRVGGTLQVANGYGVTLLLLAALSLLSLPLLRLPINISTISTD